MVSFLKSTQVTVEEPNPITVSNFFVLDEVACRTDNRIKNNMFIVAGPTRNDGVSQKFLTEYQKHQTIQGGAAVRRV